MVIAQQPATTGEPASTRSPFTRSPHDLVLVEAPPRAWTLTKIVCLVALTALGAALATAIVAGGALFTMMNFG